MAPCRPPVGGGELGDARISALDRGEYLLGNYRHVKHTSSHKFLFEGTITRGASERPSKRTEHTSILNAGDSCSASHTDIVGGRRCHRGVPPDLGRAGPPRDDRDKAAVGQSDRPASRRARQDPHPPANRLPRRQGSRPSVPHKRVQTPPIRSPGADQFPTTSCHRRGRRACTGTDGPGG